MFRNVKRATWLMVVSLAIGVVYAAAARADKPVKPPKPGDEVEFSYELIDLLGFPDNGYQSQGQFVTNRDANGDILIGGTSRLYPDPEGPAVFHPAIWRVDILGNFPATDPIDLGIPDFARGVRMYGLNSDGVVVADTKWAILQDENGNWLFPAYVDHPVWGVLELPGPIERKTSVSGINDSGVIIGTYEDYDPDAPDGVRAYSGIWQLNSDGVIDDPSDLGAFYAGQINNYGVMAGHYMGVPAVAWFEDTTLMMELLDFSPRFFGADPNALNDYPAGDNRLTVVGAYGRDENGDLTIANGYAWRPWDTSNPTTLLGTLGGASSSAEDVNKSGEIVGWADTKKDGQKAFIFKDGQMLNLNAMADVGRNSLGVALGINDDGDIVGSMGIPRPVSEQRGFLLRPIPETPPE